MTATELANAYLGANAIIATVAILVGVFDAVNRRLTIPFSSRHFLTFCYLLSLIFLLPFLVHEMPYSTGDLPPLAEIWSGEGMNIGSPISAESERLAFVVAGTPTSVSLRTAALVAVATFLIGLLFWCLRLTRDLIVTVRLLAACHTIRKQGRIRLVVSEDIEVPCSVWTPFASIILIPHTLLEDHDDLRIAIRHEAEHHRQHHTLRIYLLRLVQGLFFWNPAVHFLARRILFLQELTCDQAVAGQPGFSGESYARCLLRFAAARNITRPWPLLQAGMAFDERKSLQTRIEAVIEPHSNCRSRRSAAIITALAIAASAVVGLQFSASIQDRRIDLATAEHLAVAAQRDTGFSVVINDRVLEQLNRWVATPDGRALTQAGLLAMNQHEEFISGQLRLEGLPQELLAVPFVESRYMNVASAREAWHGIGIWSFIEPTAIRYGLEITSAKDERLNVAESTSAATRLLGDLFEDFESWDLALLAYNIGAPEVRRRMQEAGFSDAWSIADTRDIRGYDYLAGVMAAILIIENPETI